MNVFFSYLQLVRCPLVFTAIADSWAGYWIGLPAGAPASPATLAALAGISGSFYMMGMALNDLADRERDAALHPHRPIARGDVTAYQATALILALSAAGMFLLRFLPRSAFAIGGALLLVILAYDLRLKRWSIPAALSMGTCRSLNLAMGSAVHAPGTLQPAILLGAYVAAVTLVSTLEEKRPDAGRWVRWGLLGIIPLDALLVSLAGRPLAGGAILLLLAPRLALGKLFPVN